MRRCDGRPRRNVLRRKADVSPHRFRAPRRQRARQDDLPTSLGTFGEGETEQFAGRGIVFMRYATGRRTSNTSPAVQRSSRRVRWGKCAPRIRRFMTLSQSRRPAQCSHRGRRLRRLPQADLGHGDRSLGWPCQSDHSRARALPRRRRGVHGARRRNRVTDAHRWSRRCLPSSGRPELAVESCAWLVAGPGRERSFWRWP